MVRDTRQVQTAVIGDKRSDVPVVLPAEAIELTAFRRDHAHDTFWCGLLLGGCGAQLAHKLYVDRQCHFQHHSQASGASHACRRSTVGESSADHLYVKSAMSQSLLEHGRVGRFAFPPPIGSLLDVDIEGSVFLRVHMDGSVPPDWTSGRTVVLGPGVVPDPDVLASCPYVYRVRCESEGASRRVWIGTQRLAHPTEWVPISDCAWIDDGLLTPAATQILRARHPAAAHTAIEAGRRSAVVLPRSVIRFMRGLEAAQRFGVVEHVRRLCNGSGPFLDSLDAASRAEAEQALAQARTWLTAHEDYQLRVFTELAEAVTEKRTFEVRSQLQTAASLTRRGASASEQRVLAAARAFLRKQNGFAATDCRTVLTPPPPPRPPHARPPEAPPARTKEPASAREKRRSRRTAVIEARSILKRLNHRSSVSAAEQRKLVAELAAVVKTAGDWLSSDERRDANSWIKKPPASKRPAHVRAARRKLAPNVLASAAAAVRGALKKAAREQVTTSWVRLEQQLGSALPHMTIADRIEVLTLVDQATPADHALLSSLVAAGDPDMTMAYRKVTAALSLEIPADDDDLRDTLEADVERVHRYWRHR